MPFGVAMPLSVGALLCISPQSYINIVIYVYSAQDSCYRMICSIAMVKYARYFYDGFLIIIKV